jgi:hypothetical protein
VADRLQFFSPWGADRDAWRALLKDIETAASSPTPA